MIHNSGARLEGTMGRRLALLLSVLSIFCLVLAPGSAYARSTRTAPTLTLTVDATDAPRKLFRAFLDQRLYATGGAPLDGIARGGWRLTYDPKRGQRIKDQETARKQVEMGFSLGLRSNTDGLITGRDS
jgi:hypothetical protein